MIYKSQKDKQHNCNFEQDLFCAVLKYSIFVILQLKQLILLHNKYTILCMCTINIFT